MTFDGVDTYEVVEEETVVEREARVVKCERLALVWCSRDDDLSDALILEFGACPNIFVNSRTSQWCYEKQ